jgi:hypothetical protein
MKNPNRNDVRHTIAGNADIETTVTPAPRLLALPRQLASWEKLQAGTKVKFIGGATSDAPGDNILFRKGDDAVFLRLHKGCIPMFEHHYQGRIKEITVFPQFIKGDVQLLD